MSTRANRATRYPVTVVIATYQREQVLIDTLEHLQDVTAQPSEIMVMDQTPEHTVDVEQALLQLAERGVIRWVRLTQPSAPRAMNIAMQMATHDAVLFLDDDVVPSDQLVAEHYQALQKSNVWVVAGQVIQPWHTGSCHHTKYRKNGFERDLDFPINNDIEVIWENAMGCNFSMWRDKALSIGGFDQQFLKTAFRFETEFCRRVADAGGHTLFYPSATLHHLFYQSGGTRAYANRFKSSRPHHAVGDYYFAFKRGWSWGMLWFLLKHPWRELYAKIYLRQPWWMVTKLISEVRALVAGLRLQRAGPQYVAESLPDDVREWNNKQWLYPGQH